MSQDPVATLLWWSYRYLGYRSRTEKEMRDYLTKKTATYGFSPDKIEEVIKHLEEGHYIDDKSFIHEFVTSRSKSKPKGEYVLRLELMQKGVPTSLINDYFSSNTISEEDLSLKALQKVWGRYRHLDYLSRKKKSMDYLRRRGFGFEAIQKSIEEMEGRE